MPNIDAPSGFRPVGRTSGLALGALQKAYIPSSDGTAVFVGDLVKVNGSSGAAGTVVQGEDMEGVAQVIRAPITDWDAVPIDGTAGDSTAIGSIAGVVIGFKPTPDNLMLKHRAASTERIVYFLPIDQDIVWEIQEDADTTPLAAADIGLNVAMVQTQAGDAVTGRSGMELDSSSKATTNTLPIRLLGLSKTVGNAFNTAGSGSDQAKFIVQFAFRSSQYPSQVLGNTAV
jgi:hypothetical protein